MFISSYSAHLCLVDIFCFYLLKISFHCIIYLEQKVELLCSDCLLFVMTERSLMKIFALVFTKKTINDTRAMVKTAIVKSDVSPRLGLA